MGAAELATSGGRAACGACDERRGRAAFGISPRLCGVASMHNASVVDGGVDYSHGGVCGCMGRAFSAGVYHRPWQQLRVANCEVHSSKVWQNPILSW